MSQRQPVPGRLLDPGSHEKSQSQGGLIPMNEAHLIYKCRNCGEEEPTIEQSSIHISFSVVALLASAGDLEYPIHNVHDCKVGTRAISDLIRVVDPSL